MITLTGTLTVEDLRKVLTYGMLGRSQLIAVSVVGLTVIAIVLGNILFASDAGLAAILLNASPFVVLFLFWCGFIVLAPARSAKKRFATEPVWHEPAVYTFLPGAIRISRPSASSEINWSVIAAINETRSLFLLQLGKQSSIPIPKRFFADEAQIAAWKQLALSQVPSQREILAPGLVGRRC